MIRARERIDQGSIYKGPVDYLASQIFGRSKKLAEIWSLKRCVYTRRFSQVYDMQNARMVRKLLLLAKPYISLLISNRHILCSRVQIFGLSGQDPKKYAFLSGRIVAHLNDLIFGRLAGTV